MSEDNGSDLFIDVGRELLSGLLAPDAEASLIDSEPGFRHAIDTILLEDVASDEQFEAWFDDRPRADPETGLPVPGPVIAFHPDREKWGGHVTVGDKNKRPPRSCEFVDWNQIVAGAFVHEESADKDGKWFSPVKVSKLYERKKRNVTEVCVGVFDDDTGTSTERRVKSAARLGCSMVIATTFSHLTSTTAIQARKYDELAASGLSAGEILHELKGYSPEVCEGASAEERQPGAEEQVIKHRPCPRHRIAVPYLNSIDRSDYDSDAEFEKAHKERYDAVARLLGIPDYDKKCADLFRIFYTARHRPGAAHFMIEIPGRILDPFGEEVTAIVNETRAEKSSQKTRQGGPRPSQLSQKVNRRSTSRAGSPSSEGIFS